MSQDSDIDAEIISKSEQKREIQAITKLGERLIALPASVVSDYPLSELCLKAILEAQKIKSHVGKKRQIKFVGKVLRDEDLEAIQQKLLVLDQQKQLENRKLHNIEQWRDRILREGDSALNQLIIEIPVIDRQHLRQLMRNAQNEIKRDKPPKFQREIFQYLKTFMDQLPTTN
ncbi:ribosome biogenesis factor YjgA [Kangiella sp. TOML190]|uniref:ribosome biogenesis factor YjgA n=1 Tax=Kangiella sp. TOML190 TaxID=2931351 RepID=UPI00203E9D3E|nr:ribosome biogenesis factor YjgA [Kangiella sp. TOML190]